MARTIVPEQDYKSKLLKLIPTEVVAAYLVVHGILLDQKILFDDLNVTVQVSWWVFCVLLVLTPTYLRKIYGVRDRRQLTFTAASFVVWVYTIGGPFRLQGWYQPQLAACILVVWTLTIPLVIEGVEAKLKQAEPKTRGKQTGKTKGK